MLVLGIDIGGTKIAAGVVDPDGRVVARRDAATPTDSRDDLLRVVIELAGALTAEQQVGAAGIGVAGLVDSAGVVRTASHLPLRNEPLGTHVATALGLPVAVDNDANVSGLAEVRLGAARGAANAVVVTVGTGIGGALVVDGRVRRGWNGIAGEVGHIIVERDGRPCPCGSNGCWEQYASGRALMRAAADAGFMVDHGSAISAAAAAGDERAHEVFAEIGGWLGVGIASLVAVLDPEVVVVGGGVSAAGERLLEPTQASFLENLTARGKRPEPRLVLAALGPDAGLIGAAELARASA